MHDRRIAMLTSDLFGFLTCERSAVRRRPPKVVHGEADAG